MTSLGELDALRSIDSKHQTIHEVSEASFRTRAWHSTLAPRSSLGRVASRLFIKLFRRFTWFPIHKNKAFCLLEVTAIKKDEDNRFHPSCGLLVKTAILKENSSKQAAL